MSPSRLEPPGANAPDPDAIQIHALDALGDRLERAASVSIARRQHARRAPWAWGLTLAPALALLAAVVLFSTQLAPAADARVMQAADRTAGRSTGRFVMTTRITTAPAGAPPSAVSLEVDGAYDRASGRLRTSIDLSRLLGAPGTPGVPGGTGVTGAVGSTVESIQDGTTLYLRAELFTRTLPGAPAWVSIDLTKLGSAGSTAGSVQDIIGTGLSSSVVADPADLLDALRGIGSDTVLVERVDVRGVPTTHYRGTVHLATAAAAAGPADATRLREGFAHLGLDAADAQLPVDVWVDDDGDVRRVETTLDLSRARNADGTAMGTGPTTVTTDYLDLGRPAPIEVPAGNVVDITAMVQGALTGPLGGVTPTTQPR